MNRLKNILLSAAAAAFMLSCASCAVPFLDSSEPSAGTAASTGTTVSSAVTGTTAVTASGTVFSEPEDSLAEYEFSMPEYTDADVIELNGNRPCFSGEDTFSGESTVFSELDSLGRCGTAFCLVSRQTLPTEERGPIGMVKPAGWHTVKYRCVDGKYLYNRCHLIAYELCGVNADQRNLITGTRWLNVEGMLPAEDRVRRFAEDTGISVFYRVTPRYEGSELLPRGVEIEALSAEDGGRGLSLHIFCFNVQPGIVIDYLTGGSYPLDPEDANVEEYPDSEGSRKDSSEVYIPPEGVTYILNTNSHRFHRPGCQSVQDMKAGNRAEFYGTAEELIAVGYVPCGACRPTEPS
ncbi:DNA-entry nuclease [Ruminococcaceae bacterium FB2012]|nr:DNA-entry nuclease [Ruminococcaceae bacterium FB2012]